MCQNIVTGKTKFKVENHLFVKSGARDWAIRRGTILLPYQCKITPELIPNGIPISQA